MAQTDPPATLPDVLPDSWRSLWIPAILCFLLLILEAYSIFRNFGSELGETSGSSRPQIARLTSISQQVRQKSDGSLIWQMPEIEQSLFQEDAIATMDGSEAVVTFADGSELTVEPNSLVILEQAPVFEAQGSKGERAASPQVIARLVKGSVRRKSTTASSLIIRLSSSKSAKPVVLDDRAGNAVFRLVFRGSGMEITIESGSIAVNGDKLLKSPQNAMIVDGEVKLPPPRLNKPKVEFQKRDPHSSLDRVIEFMLAMIGLRLAHAASVEAQAQEHADIHFNWEKVENAERYLIQISRKPDFSELELEDKRDTTEFLYTIPAPEKPVLFFFRVAAISGEGKIGEFSEPQRVEIVPEPAPIRSPRPAHTFDPAPVPNQAKAPELPKSDKKITTARMSSPPPILPQKSQAIRTEAEYQAEVAYGAQFHQRTLTSDNSPQRANGSGFVPARARLELKRVDEKETVLILRASLLAETATPKLPSPANKPLSTPVFSLTGLYGRPWSGMILAFGPYASTSSELTSNGLTMQSASRLLFGLDVGLSSRPDQSRAFSWTADLGLVGVGGPGVELGVRIKRHLFSNFHYVDFKKRGFFTGAELQSRLISGESAISGTLELGYSF